MIPSYNRIEILVKGATSVLLGVKGLRVAVRLSYLHAGCHACATYFCDTVEGVTELCIYIYIMIRSWMRWRDNSIVRGHVYQMYVLILRLL